jgi:hypothetical protein
LPECQSLTLATHDLSWNKSYLQNPLQDSALKVEDFGAMELQLGLIFLNWFQNWDMKPIFLKIYFYFFGENETTIGG